MSEYSSIPMAFQERVAVHPAKTGIVYLGTYYSYHRIWAWARAMAGSLSELGIGPGDRVILYLPNWPQWVIAWLGLLIQGAVIVPISPIYPARDLEFVARDSGAKAIICGNDNIGYVNQVQPTTGLTQVIYTSAVDLLPPWKRALALLFDKKPRGRIPRRNRPIPMTSLLRERSTEPLEIKTAGRDMAMLLYTGGTTQLPRGVPYTHELLLEPVKVQFDTMASIIKPGENTIMLAVPLFHIMGLTFGPMALAINGETVILLPRLNLDGLMDGIQREKAASLFGSPGLYRLLLEHDRFTAYDLSSLRYCFVGGDVFAGQVGERWRARTGISIKQAYGTTETGGGVALSRVEAVNPPNSVGQPLPNKLIRLVDPETLVEKPSGEPGELLVHSNPMIESYWQRPEETASAFINIDGRLWYRTGDIMRLDQDGYLYFVDRLTDAVQTAGRSLSVSQIELVIQDHPAVMGACVVGLSGQEEQWRLKAFVVLRDNQKGLSGQELLAWLGQRLPAHMVPHSIEFRDTLPKSKVGKLLRRELRNAEGERFRKGAFDQAIDD